MSQKALPPTLPKAAMSLRRCIQRVAGALRAAAGAFDLPSILVGVVVVGILTAGVLAALFGVIPAAQDNSAKSDAAAVKTAEGVALAKDGRYMDTTELIAAGYLSMPTATASGGGASDGEFTRVSAVVPELTYAVGVNPSRSCFVVLSKSATGAMFYISDQASDPTPWTSDVETGCLSKAEVQSMADSMMGDMQLASFGAYGDGSTKSTTPVAAVGLKGSISGLSMNNWGSCGVADAKAYCWGPNWGGQLGNGTTTNSQAPSPVSTDGVLNGKAVTKVSVGSNHACAVADAAAYCWGLGAHGGLGNGSTLDSKKPVAVIPDGVLAGKKVTDVAAGTNFSCAVADAAAFCWGKNNASQLGNGLTADSAVPVAVTGLPEGAAVTSVALQQQRACVVAGGKAYCWGQGALGSWPGSSTTPRSINMAGDLAGKTITSVSLGYYSGCALTSDAQAFCWGSNSEGQLGNGTTTYSDNPVAVALAGQKVSSISVGGEHACALTDGGAYCWGSNTLGQLGDGSGLRSTTPVKVSPGVTDGKALRVISAGNAGSLIAYL